MNYLERKTKDGEWIYETNELGDFMIISPERLDVDIVEGLHMKFMKIKKEVNKKVELTGHEKGDIDVEIKYSPFKQWDEDRKVEKTIFEKIKMTFFKIKIKLQNLWK
ncbi:MAG: hypothetical protein ACOCTT_04335 [archaeon]